MGWFVTTGAELRRAAQLIEQEPSLYYVAGFLKSRADGHEDAERVCLSTNQDRNGYTNWETWATMLWIGNDAALQGAVYAIGREHELEDGALAEALKDYIGERYGQGENEEPTLGTELTEGSLSEINWQEIARHVHEESRDNG